MFLYFRWRLRLENTEKVFSAACFSPLQFCLPQRWSCWGRESIFPALYLKVCLASPSLLSALVLHWPLSVQEEEAGRSRAKEKGKRLALHLRAPVAHRLNASCFLNVSLSFSAQHSPVPYCIGSMLGIWCWLNPAPKELWEGQECPKVKYPYFNPMFDDGMKSSYSFLVCARHWGYRNEYCVFPVLEKFLSSWGRGRETWE